MPLSASHLSELINTAESIARTSDELLRSALGLMQSSYIRSINNNLKQVLTWLSTPIDNSVSVEEHIYYITQDCEPLLRSVVSNASFLLENPDIFVGEDLNDSQRDALSTIQLRSQRVLYNTKMAFHYLGKKLGILKPFESSPFALNKAAEVLLSAKELTYYDRLNWQVEETSIPTAGDEQYTAWAVEALIPLILEVLGNDPITVETFSGENDGRTFNILQIGIPNAAGAYDAASAAIQANWQPDDQTPLWQTAIHTASNLISSQNGMVYIDVNGDMLLLLLALLAAT